MRSCALVTVGAIGLLSVVGTAEAQVLHAPLPEWARPAVLEPAPDSPLMAAIERAALASPNPVVKRERLLARLYTSIACYPSNLSDRELDDLVRKTGLLPPTEMGAVHPRFQTDTQCWFGQAQLAESGKSRGAQLTYSFPADGTPWGLACSGVPTTGPNGLNAQLTTTFSSLDRGREFIRSSIASWRRYANLQYTEVADDNTPMTIQTLRSTTRGDIRIGGIALGTSSVPLAYNALPAAVTTNCSGGDMLINLSYFSSGFFNSTIGNFLYFRNTIAHEHGHGLGYLHTIPCNQTKLMEPQIHTLVDQLSSDEIRAVMRNYGDRFGDNHTPAFAKDFGSLTSPSVRSVIARDLGVNGTAVILNSTVPPTVLAEDDYFRFSLDSTQTVTISVTPTGYSPSDFPSGTCANPTSQVTWCQGPQSGGGCNGTINSVDAKQAGNLDLQLLQSNGTSVIASSTSTTLGATEMVTQTLNPGTYYVRVWDSGGAPINNQILQTYDLVVRVGSSLAPPVAIAGLPVKRCQAGQVCYFIGSHNSYATEASATLPTSGFAWDLDGNGTFETANQTQPQTTYVSNGTFPVTLRLTDSNGQVATDTIQVIVFGATTSVTSVLPGAVEQGSTIGVTINGTNLKGVTSASQISVLGGGVTVTGTPTVNPLGTRITGLSMVISPGATIGFRDITISNSDGQGTSGTSVQVLEITQSIGSGACCATDGSCTVANNSGSCTGAFQGSGTTCAPNNCPQPAMACCEQSGACTSLSFSDCTNSGGTPMGSGSVCTPNPCPQPMVACCNTLGQCSLLTAADCTSGGGTPQGAGSTCASNPCIATVGACCRGATCAVIAPINCFGANSRFVGVGVACNPGATTPCCAADFNQDQSITPADIFDYLNAWFMSDPQADINGGGITPQDIFDYLNAWFTGC